MSKRLRVLYNWTVAVPVLCAAATASADPILWVNDSNGVLGTVDVSTGNVHVIGNTGAALTDIAFAPNGDLYGISFENLYSINPVTAVTAAATVVGATDIPDGIALVFGSDGTLYGAGNRSTYLYSINPATGAATSLGNIGFRSAGDLAFIGSDLYLSSHSNLGPKSLQYTLPAVPAHLRPTMAARVWRKPMDRAL
jgi:hypothetical protein